MKLVLLDSGILGGNSMSRQLSASIVTRLRETYSGLEVVYCDLAAQPIPHPSGAYVAASRVALDGPHELALQTDLALGEPLMERFHASDIVGIGVAFYGLGSPARPMEHAETYLRGPFGLLGDSPPEVINAEGVSVGPEQCEAALTSARDQIAVLEAA